MVTREPAKETGKKPKCFGAFDDGEGDCDKCHNDVAASCKSKTHNDMLDRVAASADKKSAKKASELKTKSTPAKKKPKRKTPKKAAKTPSKKKRK